jgi:hypothetical protein
MATFDPVSADAANDNVLTSPTNGYESCKTGIIADA